MSRSETAGNTGTTVEFTLSVKVTRGDDGTTTFAVSSEPPYPHVEDRARQLLPGDIQLKEGCNSGEITLMRNAHGFEERIVDVTFGQQFKENLVGLVDDGYSTFGNLENTLAALDKTQGFQNEVGRVTTIILDDPALLAQLQEIEMKAQRPCQYCGDFHEDGQSGIQVRIQGRLSSWLETQLKGALEYLRKQGSEEAEEPQQATLVFHVDPRIANHIFFGACGGMPRVKEMTVQAVQDMLVKEIVHLDGLLTSGHEELVEAREMLVANHERNLRQLAQASDSAARAATDLTAKASTLAAAGLVLPALASDSLIEHGDERDSTEEGGNSTDGKDDSVQAGGNTGDEMSGDGLPDVAPLATSGETGDSADNPSGDDNAQAPAQAPIAAA